MTDWNSLPGGKDFSHWQGTIDWDKEASEQPAFVIIKATQGTGTDPKFDFNRKSAADRNLLWLPYPMLNPGDGDAAIQHFINVVGEKVPPALDWELAGTSSSVVESWIDACDSEMVPWGLMYYGMYPPDRVTPKIAQRTRWFPQYPGSDTAPPRLPMWDGSTKPDWSKMWFIWQWSEKVRDPAAQSLVDADRLSCSIDTFRTWRATGNLLGTVTPPIPIPTPSPVQPNRVLRLNMTGDDVLALQTALNSKGYRIATDGYFGPATRIAIVSFQSSHNLNADGIVGSNTRAALNI